VRHAATSLTGADGRRLVARVVGYHRAPTRIRSDHGSAFIWAAWTDWLPGVGAKPIPVAAGSPWENGAIASCPSRGRDEFWERTAFASAADARAKGKWYRRDSNTVRPHSSLGSATPSEFRAACDRQGGSPGVSRRSHVAHSIRCGKLPLGLDQKTGRSPGHGAVRCEVQKW
jgi:putative transposase